VDQENERKVEVEGRHYRLRSWSVGVGQTWAFKLTRIAMGAGTTESEPAAVASLLERVTVDEFGAFRDACLRFTDLVERDADGEELVLDLSKNPTRLEGRYLDLYAIMEGHLVHEFGPFFDGLRRRFEAEKEKAKKKAAAAG
jgi:hypothetical protein